MSKPMGSHFGGIGEFTTHVRTYLGGDWDVHWGYGLLTHGQVTQDQRVESASFFFQLGFSNSEPQTWAGLRAPFG